MSAHKPLEGVKVVELASFVAAPTAGRMMAEMGADVIRVESTAGDPWRFYGANCGLPITDEENPLFDIYNLGKKDIQLNTKTPEGKEILFHLLDEADVFITNNRLKSLVRSGLDYESFLLVGYTGTSFLDVGTSYNTKTIAAVVIGGTAITGGKGGYLGTIAGAVIMTILDDFLTIVSIPDAGRQVVQGIIIILSGCFMTCILSGRYQRRL